MKNKISKLFTWLFEDFIKWASDRPVLSHFINSVFCFTACLFALFEPDYKIQMAFIFIWSSIFIYFVTKHKALNKVIVSVFCLLFASPNQANQRHTEENENNATGIVVGCALVVGVSAVIYFKVIPFCKKHFDRPKGTNSSSLRFYLDDGGDGSDFAAISCEKDNCGDDFNLVEWREEPKPNIFEISGYLNYHGEVVNMNILKRDEENVIDYHEWLYELSLLGLNPSYSFGKSYSINGMPCPAYLSPVVFHSAGRISIKGGNVVSKKVLVQKSEDLKVWKNLLDVNIPVGFGIFVSDMPDSPHCSYRMIVTEANK